MGKLTSWLEVRSDKICWSPSKECSAGRSGAQIWQVSRAIDEAMGGSRWIWHIVKECLL